MNVKTLVGAVMTVTGITALLSTSFLFWLRSLSADDLTQLMDEWGVDDQLRTRLEGLRRALRDESPVQVGGGMG